MIATSPNAAAGYRRALAKRGIPVTVTRINGVSPNAVTVTAQVSAVVIDYTPDTTTVEQTGYSASKVGALTQGDRLVILMGDDLQAQGFPLPMRKHDRITLPTQDVLDVVEVDPFKRGVAGAIELKAAGIA